MGNKTTKNQPDEKQEEKQTQKQKEENVKKDKDKEITELHDSFEFAYDMMLGIRHTVSKQMQEPWRRKILDRNNHTIPNDDELFTAQTKYFFPAAGSGGLNPTPPHKMRDFHFKDYCPEIFNQLREWFGLDPREYLLSLCGNFNLIEFVSNSKSGEFFFYSHDRQFLIKTMPKSESILLRRLLPEYFNYISRQPNTLMTKFFGMHRVKTPARWEPVYFMIMGSVFNSTHDIHKIYDLKGSHYKRRAKKPKGEERNNKVPILKDLDWLDNKERLRVDAMTAKLFSDQLRRDIEFLKKLKIMDYSLLIGVHDFSKARKESKNNADQIGDEFDEITGELNPQTYGINTRKRKKKKLLAKRPTDMRVNFDNFDLDFLDDDEVDARHMTLRAIRNNPLTAESGGMKSADGGSLYFTGIIDILQLYNKRKKLENMWGKLKPKVPVETISCIPPDDYGQRLYDFVNPFVGTVPLKNAIQYRRTQGRTVVSQDNMDDSSHVFE